MLSVNYWFSFIVYIFNLQQLVLALPLWPLLLHIGTLEWLIQLPLSCKILIQDWLIQWYNQLSVCIFSKTLWICPWNYCLFLTLQLGLLPPVYPQRPGQIECDVRTYFVLRYTCKSCELLFSSWMHVTLFWVLHCELWFVIYQSLKALSCCPPIKRCHSLGFRAVYFEVRGIHSRTQGASLAALLSGVCTSMEMIALFPWTLTVVLPTFAKRTDVNRIYHKEEMQTFQNVNILSLCNPYIRSSEV